jgi:hypothetical protein
VALSRALHAQISVEQMRRDAMGDVLVPRLIQGSTRLKQNADLCVDGLLGRTGAVALKELQRLCPFVPLLVLVPEASLKENSQDEDLTPKLLTSISKGGQHASRLSPESEFAFGEVIVNFPEMVALRRGEPVRLTVMEFKTLTYLVRNPRRVISRDELLNEVWGYENYPNTRTVDNHVLRLRKKLEKHPAEPEHFCTVHGAGYKFLP